MDAGKDNDDNTATTAAITLMKERLSNFETKEGRLTGLAYNPRKCDVGISTTPKAGTTWMQQICHQIRCADYPDQCMAFQEISEVVPWIELAVDQGQDLDEPQPPIDSSVRLFKTHCWFDHCPKFPKTIVVFRDPCDVVLSFYHFFEGWFFNPGEIDLQTFAEEFWLARGIPDETKMQNASYFIHLLSWYKRRDDPGILIVFFEDLKDDLKGQIRRITRFLSNEDHQFERETVVAHAFNHSSFHFMKQHEEQFDERLSKLSRNEACGMSKTAGMNRSKINSGNQKKIIPENVKSMVEEKWKEIVAPETKCATYNDLRKQLSTSLAAFER